MASVYMKQRKELSPGEDLTNPAVDYLNKKRLPSLMEMLGVNLNPGGKTPESNGVPRLFILDEEAPDKPRTLEESNVAIGSVEFWSLARRGKLFGYPAGQKEPSQIQLKGNIPGSLELSEPFSTEKGKSAARDFQPELEMPKLAAVPAPAPRPGWFSRLMHRINSNWYKAENEAYRQNQEERTRIMAENQAKEEEYRLKVRQEKEAMEKVCQALSAGAEKAFGAKRTAEAFAAEEEIKAAYKEQSSRAKEAASVKKAAEDALKKEKWIDRAETWMTSLYGPKPVELEAMIDGKHIKKGSTGVLTDMELPDVTIGDTKVTPEIFANLALHAQLDPKIVKDWAAQNDGERRLKGLMEEGLTEQEAQHAIIHSAGGMLVGDVVKYSPRVNLQQYFDCTQAGREQAQAALEEYRSGNPEKLAQIITQAAKYVADETKALESLSDSSTLADAKLTGELLDLAEKDDKLMDACGALGLTEGDMDACRGADYIRELDDGRRAAEAKLAQAALDVSQGKPDLSPEEKKDCLHAIFKFRTADARITGQMRKSPEKLEKDLKHISDRARASEKLNTSGTKPPAGVKPLPSNLRIDLVLHMKLKNKPSPTALDSMAEYRQDAVWAKEANEEPEANKLDEMADLTIQSLHLESMSTGKLAEKLLGGQGLKDEALLIHQGTLVKAREREKPARSEPQMQEELELDPLNTAVIYDEHGAQL